MFSNYEAWLFDTSMSASGFWHSERAYRMLSGLLEVALNVQAPNCIVELTIYCVNSANSTHAQNVKSLVDEAELASDSSR